MVMVVFVVVAVDKTGHVSDTGEVSWPAPLPDVSNTIYDSQPTHPPDDSYTRCLMLLIILAIVGTLPGSVSV